MEKHLNFLAQRSPLKHWFINVIVDMQEFIRLLVAEQIEPCSGGMQVQLHAIQLWRRLHFRLLLTRAWTFDFGIIKDGA